MDESEKAAEEYILHLGFKRVKYEPEGKKKPPDFLIDGRIAVEVTRLNRHVGVSAKGKRVGEESAIPVERTVARVLRSFGPPMEGFSWFVDVECSLPAPGKAEIEREVAKHLKAFQNSALQKPTQIQVFDSFAIKLRRADQPGPNYFLMGSFNHDTSGALLSEEFERNLKICIDDKTAAVSSIRSKYPEWWLALDDLVSYGHMDAEDRVRIPPHNWDKIILINPRDPTQSFELA